MSNFYNNYSVFVNNITSFFSSITSIYVQLFFYCDIEFQAKGVSAQADKSGIVSTKSKDKFCRDRFLSFLRCPHLNFQSGQILSTP